MNKQTLLDNIADEVYKKHPWYVLYDKYLKIFEELPLDFLEEKLLYDNLIEKSKKFKRCQLILSEVKIEIKLTLDECIIWELNLDKWQEAKIHNIVSADIKKILKRRNNE